MATVDQAQGGRAGGAVTFPWAAVRMLLDQALACSSHKPTFGQILDPSLRRDGRRPSFEDRPSATDVEQVKLRPGLILVGTVGIYLLSNDAKEGPRPQGGVGSVHGAVYAIEANPQKHPRSECIITTARLWGAAEGTEFLDAGIFSGYDRFFSDHKVPEPNRGIRVELSDEALVVLPCKLETP